ncbi:hypothetical protein M0R04_09775 [Candidatus Dojkabacteria bacterium]|jgi:hypothetical protein|nr:hypothetical protein [Candidatus Dojkabacteria bacterium]
MVLLNSTMNVTEGLGGVTFDTASAITTSLPMIVAFAVVWGLPLFLYLLWGATASARTSDGRVLKSKVISNANFWIGFIIFGLVQFGLFLLLVFPVWLLPFS